MSIIEKYKIQCTKSIDGFKDRVFGEKNTPWVSRGILTSEGFSVCAAMDLYNIDMFIESGVYNGRSTQMWANYRTDIPIITMDKEYITESAYQRLSKYDNLEIRKSNAFDIIPSLIKQNSDKTIGIFLDGPKGEPAYNFATGLYRNKNVTFICFHDMSKDVGRRPSFERRRKQIGAKEFFTDEQWYVDAYSFLDDGEKSKPHDLGDSWAPYTHTYKDGTVKDFGGSYGWTIGFYLKEI